MTPIIQSSKSSRSFGFSATAEKIGWIYSTNPGSTSYVNDIQYDYTNNVLVLSSSHYVSANNTRQMVISKIDKDTGTVIARKNLYYSGINSQQTTGVAVNSSNYYLSGYTEQSGTSRAVVAIYNPSNLNLNYQRSYWDPYNAATYALDISINPYSYDYPTTAGYHYESGGVINAHMVTYDSSGSITQSRRFNYGSSTTLASCTQTTSSGIPRIIVTGQYSGYGFVSYWNTSGFAHQWTTGFSNCSISDCEVDGNGNIYVVGKDNGTYSSYPGGFIAKLNNSGSVLWKKNLRKADVASRDINFADLTVDISGNIYVNGNCSSDHPINGTSGDSTVIAKYDSNGNLIWQRRVYYTAGNNNSGESIFIDINSASNSLYFGGGYGSGSPDATIAKINTGGLPKGSFVVNELNSLVIDEASYTSDNSTASVQSTSPSSSGSWNPNTTAHTMTDAVVSVVSEQTILIP